MLTPTQTSSSSGKFSTYFALTCFGIGTLLLLLHLVFPYEDRILILGFFYLVMAIISNLIVLLTLCYQWHTKPHDREIIVIRILILLSNIPIALLYLYIVFHK